MDLFRESKTKIPIINCHTHIFKGDHVPPYLARTFMPWPLYYLLPVSLIISLFRFWYDKIDPLRFQPWYENIGRFFYRIKIFFVRSGLVRILVFIVGTWLTLHVFYILLDWISAFSAPADSISKPIEDARIWLTEHNLLYVPSSLWLKLLFILLLIIFFEFGKNLLWFVLKKIWSFLGVLPGPKTKQLAERYIMLGRFAFYTEQSNIFQRLRNQYPEGSGFVVLPMDMEYMGAGKLKREFSYEQQMKDLAEIKKKETYEDIFYPFVFAEPRRMAEEGSRHFAYRIDQGKVILEDCFIRDYIEDNKFSGFKIYPALGYYPFDEVLLPLWKYAADAGLPILTHCIRGTIYYRGIKKKEWDNHPVFEQASGKGRYEPLALSELKNMDYINNFTHPLNYLCLLEEKLLRKVVAKARDNKIRDLFGYSNDDTPLQHNLSHLKLCFGHFGGDDEWHRFFELDRENYSSQIVKNPDQGILFLTNEAGEPRPGKLEQIWKYVDWYSIICSMMLQYHPYVYADLSYIIHSPVIQPLLSQTLMNPKLKTQVLFGTDFYVVRNHKSEKNMLADVIDHLSDAEFDQLARINPRSFLASNLHGPVKI